MMEYEYLRQIPRAVPAGKVVVHNTARATRRLGQHGFRAWLSPTGTERLELCNCGWARPELGEHFRVVKQERGE